MMAQFGFALLGLAVLVVLGVVLRMFKLALIAVAVVAFAWWMMQ